MIVYGSTLSPYVRKVMAFAAEKGLTPELKPISLGEQDPAFREASPFGKMPGFRHDDFAISDSSAIITYLDAIQPDPNLIPTEARARARAVWFDEFADTILMATGAAIFGNRFVRPRVLQQDPDHAAADAAEREALPKLLDYLETVIPDSGFLVEDRLTLADIAVASPFGTISTIGVDVDAGRHPRAAAYLAGIFARPSFAQTLAGDKALVAKLGGPVTGAVPA